MNIQDEILKADHFLNTSKLREALNGYIQISEYILVRIKEETNINESNDFISRPIDTKLILDNLNYCYKQIQFLFGEFELNQNEAQDDQTSTKKLQSEYSKFSEILIPFSPLYKLITINKQAYEVAKERMQAAKRQNSKFSIEAWRRLSEDFRLQRKNWEEVTKQISSASKINMMSIDVAIFAKNLTQLDSMLFQKLDLQNPIKFLSNNAQSNYALACTHFQLYIASVVAHSIITAGYHPHPTHLQRAHTIQYFIRLAHHLLIQYRNFNSFSAVIQALSSPQVKRLNQVWDLVPQKYCDRLNEFLKLTSEQDRHHFYFMELNQRIEHCQYFGTALLVIPWMHPHFTDGQSIYSNHGSSSASDPSDITLSEYGSSKLTSIIELLKHCYSANHFQSGRASPTMSIGGMSSSTNFSRFRSSRMAADIEPHLPPLKLPSNLSSLGEQNIQISHWILTRVKPTQAQLWELSHKVQSASPEDLRRELPLPDTNPEPNSNSLSSSFSLDLDVSNTEIFTGDGKSSNLSSISDESLGANDKILEDLGDDTKREPELTQDNQNQAQSFLDLRNTPSPIPPPVIDGLSFLNQENPWQAERPSSNNRNYTNGDANERSLSCSDSLKFETLSHRESNSSPQDFKRASPISSPSLGSSHFHANNLNQLPAFFQNKKEPANQDSSPKPDSTIVSNDPPANLQESNGYKNIQNEQTPINILNKESSQDQNISAFVQDFESIYPQNEQSFQNKRHSNENNVNTESNENHIDLPLTISDGSLQNSATPSNQELSDSKQLTDIDNNVSNINYQLNIEIKKVNVTNPQGEVEPEHSTNDDQLVELKADKKDDETTKDLTNGASVDQRQDLPDDDHSLNNTNPRDLHVDSISKKADNPKTHVQEEKASTKPSVNGELQHSEVKKSEQEFSKAVGLSENIQHRIDINGDVEVEQNGFKYSDNQIVNLTQKESHPGEQPSTEPLVEDIQQSSDLELTKVESSSNKEDHQNHVQLPQGSRGDHTDTTPESIEEKEKSQNEDDLMEQGLLPTKFSPTEEELSVAQTNFKFNPKAQTFVPKSINNDSFTKSETSNHSESFQIQSVNKNILELQHSTLDDISKAFPIPNNSQEELDSYISNNSYIKSYPSVVTINQAPQFNGKSESETQGELAPEQQKFASTLSLLKKSNRSLAVPVQDPISNDQNGKNIVSDLLVKLINPESPTSSQDGLSPAELKSTKLPSTLSSLKKKTPVANPEPVTNNLQNTQQENSSQNQPITSKSVLSLPTRSEKAQRDQNEEKEKPQIARKSLSSLPSKNTSKDPTNNVPSNVKQIYSLVSSNLKSPSHIDDEFIEALKLSAEPPNYDNQIIEPVANNSALNNSVESNSEPIESASNDISQSESKLTQSVSNSNTSISELTQTIESPRLDGSMENTPDLVGITPIHSPESGSVRSQSDTLVTPRLELDSISTSFQDLNRTNKSANLAPSGHHNSRANKAPLKWDEDFEGTESLNSVSPQSERFSTQVTPSGPRVNENDTIEYFSFQAYKSGDNPIQKIFKFGLRNPKPDSIQQHKSQADTLNQVFVPYHHLGFNPNLHNSFINQSEDYGNIRNGYDRNTPHLTHEYSYKEKTQKA